MSLNSGLVKRIASFANTSQPRRNVERKITTLMFARPNFALAIGYGIITLAGGRVGRPSLRRTCGQLESTFRPATRRRGGCRCKQTDPRVCQNGTVDPSASKHRNSRPVTSPDLGFSTSPYFGDIGVVCRSDRRRQPARPLVPRNCVVVRRREIRASCTCDRTPFTCVRYEIKAK
jgi:hypothetical protein